MIKPSVLLVFLLLSILLFFSYFFTSTVCGPDHLFYNGYLTGEEIWGSSGIQEIKFYNSFIDFFTFITHHSSVTFALFTHKIILFFIIFYVFLISNKNYRIASLFTILCIHHIAFTRSDFVFLLIAIYLLIDLTVYKQAFYKRFNQITILFISITSHFSAGLILGSFYILKLLGPIYSKLNFISPLYINICLFLIFLFILGNYVDILSFLSSFDQFSRLSGYIDGGKAKIISESIMTSRVLLILIYSLNLFILIFYFLKVKNYDDEKNILFLLFFYSIILMLIFFYYGTFSRLSPLIFILTFCIYYLIDKNFYSDFLFYYIVAFLVLRAYWLMKKPYMIECFVDNFYSNSKFLLN